MQGVSALFKIIAAIKRVKRDAWKRRGHWHVPESESVADHSFGGALSLGLVLYTLKIPGIDLFKVVLMFLIHDLIEDKVTDINIYKERDLKKRARLIRKKKRLERERIEQIRIELGPVMGELVYQLWLEYDAGTTPEAKLAKEFDKLEVLMQALAYCEEGNTVNIWEFWGNVWPRIHTPEIREWIRTEICPRILAVGLTPPPEGFPT